MASESHWSFELPTRKKRFGWRFETVALASRPGLARKCLTLSFAWKDTALGGTVSDWL